MSQIQIDEKKCVSCGACTAVCSSKALELDKKTWALSYNTKACSSCKSCIEACPLRAISTSIYSWCSYV